MTRRRKGILAAFGAVALAVAVTGTAIGTSAPPVTEMPLPKPNGTRAFGMRGAPGTEVAPGLTLPAPPPAALGLAGARASEAPPIATIWRNGRYEQVVAVQEWVESQVITGLDGKPYTASGGWRDNLDATYQQPAIAVSSSPNGPFVAASEAPPPPVQGAADPAIGQPTTSETTD